MLSESLRPNERLHFLADLWSQSEFRTQRNAERKTNPKSELTQCRVYVYGMGHSTFVLSTIDM